jgi:hypothetical protein
MTFMTRSYPFLEEAQNILFIILTIRKKVSEYYKRRDCLKTQITITYYGLYNITGKGESQENDCLELNVKHNKDYRPNEQSEKKLSLKVEFFLI